MKHISSYLTLAFAGLALFSSCKDDDDNKPAGPAVVTVDGDNKTVGTNGFMKSWARTVDGKLDAVGVTMNQAALNSFNTDTVMMELHLPPAASQAGLEFMMVDFNPSGHEPAPIYSAPHFDFHFYMIGHNAVNAIAPGPDMVPVQAQHIAPNYWYGNHAAVPFAVPAMGVHYVDTTSHEFSPTGTFDKTFIYGYYQGNMIFMEPMITKAYLMSHPNFTGDIKQPAAYQRTGKYYPTKYSIKHDAAKGEYTVALESYVMR